MVEAAGNTLGLVEAIAAAELVEPTAPGGGPGRRRLTAGDGRGPRGEGPLGLVAMTMPSTDQPLDQARAWLRPMSSRPPATPLGWSRRSPRPSPCSVTSPSTTASW